MLLQFLRYSIFSDVIKFSESKEKMFNGESSLQDIQKGGCSLVSKLA